MDVFETIVVTKLYNGEKYAIIKLSMKCTVIKHVNSV